jgi:DNA-binding winged helix-turn-helix (wHTH) protein/tetratricopeptide (TPR) repeat protein
VKTGEVAFGPFRLDRKNALLWRGGERIVLAPKPFEVLCCLVERAGELVTKDELLDTVWAQLHVSESSLSVAVNALRSALADDKQAPQYIETVTRRGYRLIAPVSAVLHSDDTEGPSVRKPPASAAASPERQRWWVGRSAPLEVLEGALRQASAGNRQVVFVTGEAGIGKTTLLDMAMQRMSRSGVDVLRCSCNELFGTHEAFLPLIEAFQEQCAGDDGPFLLKALRDHAPTWLAQMPGFLASEDRAEFQRDVFGATRERMLREFSDLIENVSAARPWVIILEDLHWSDLATIDALSRAARRDRKAAILILATYRPTDVAVAGHPVRTVHQDLQIHGRCTEVALDRLTLPEVEHYFALRFASADWINGLADRVFARTHGQPLFVTSMVDHLIARGAIKESGGSWQLASEQAMSFDDMPRDLRQMISRQIERLTGEERRLLETASAAGIEFSALLAAGALDIGILEAEQVFEQLTQTGHMLWPAGMAEWPNGMVSGCYAFQHALYQEVLYQRLAPGRRAQTHARLGESLETGYGARAPEVASILARHFELGHDFAKAVRYLTLAAESSARRFSTREAASYLTRALDLVGHLPAEAQSPARLKLLHQRAWVWRAAGDFVHSLEDLAAMIACAVEAGQLRAEVSGLLDLSRFCLYADRRKCVKLAEQALAKSRAIDDKVFRGLVQGNVANLNLMLRGWTAEDAEFCRQAIAATAGSTDPTTLMRHCAIEMVLEYLRSDYRACCVATRRGRELARVIGDIYLFALFNTIESCGLIYLGAWDEVQQNVAAALAMTARNVNPQAGALYRLTIGWMHAEIGDFETAAKCGEDTLNAAVEANPFNFFVGKALLASAYVGMGKLPLARAQFEMIDHRIEVDDVAMESLIMPPYLLSRCEYWLATGDMGRAREAALALHAASVVAPDRPFLAVAHSLMARIAMRAGELREARAQLCQALSIVRNAELPLASRRVYAAAAELYESCGEPDRAKSYGMRSEQILTSLTDSLRRHDLLRSTMPLARVS